MDKNLEFRMTKHLLTDNNALFVGADIVVKVPLKAVTDDDYTEVNFKAEVRKVQYNAQQQPSLSSHLTQLTPQPLSNGGLASSTKSSHRNVKKKIHGLFADFASLGKGYDDTDGFIDDSEAFEEVVPHEWTTNIGGFYINQGPLDFVKIDKPISSTKNIKEMTHTEVKSSAKSDCGHRSNKKIKTSSSQPISCNNTIGNGDNTVTSSKSNEAKKVKKASRKLDTMNTTETLLDSSLTVTPPNCKSNISSPATISPAITSSAISTTAASTTSTTPTTANSSCSSQPISSTVQACELQEGLDPDLVEAVSNITKSGPITKKQLLESQEIQASIMSVIRFFQTLPVKIKTNVVKHVAWKLNVSKPTILKYMKESERQYLENISEDALKALKKVYEPEGTISTNTSRDQSQAHNNSAFDHNRITSTTGSGTPSQPTTTVPDFKTFVALHSEQLKSAIYCQNRLHELSNSKESFYDQPLIDFLQNKLVNVIPGLKLSPEEIRSTLAILNIKAMDIKTIMSRALPVKPSNTLKDDETPLPPPPPFKLTLLSNPPPPVTSTAASTHFPSYTKPNLSSNNDEKKASFENSTAAAAIPHTLSIRPQKPIPEPNRAEFLPSQHAQNNFNVHNLHMMPSSPYHTAYVYAPNSQGSWPSLPQTLRLRVPNEVITPQPPQYTGLNIKPFLTSPTNSASSAYMSSPPRAQSDISSKQVPISPGGSNASPQDLRYSTTRAVPRTPELALTKVSNFEGSSNMHTQMYFQSVPNTPAPFKSLISSGNVPSNSQLPSTRSQEFYSDHSYFPHGSVSRN